MADAPPSTPGLDPNQMYQIPWDQLFGPDNLTTTSVQELPDWLKPYAQGILSRAQTLSNAPYPYPDQRVAAFTPAQQAGQAATLGYAQGSEPMVNLANAVGMDTLSGQYLNPDTNPYLAQTYNRAAKGVTDQYMYATNPQRAANFSKSGAFGGSADQQQQGFDKYGLGQNLSDLANQIYGGNYQQERQRQYGQQSYTPGILNQQYIGPQAMMDVGAAQQGQMQNVLNTGYQNVYNRADWPYKALGIMENAYGTVAPGAGGTGTTTGPNPNQASGLSTLMGLGYINAFGNQGFGGGSRSPFNYVAPGTAPGFGQNSGFPYYG